jgi:hypothetical protein
VGVLLRLRAGMPKEVLVRKLFAALVVGGMVFGAVIASAAALNVNGGIIQVGTNTGSLSCDNDGVSVVWNVDQHGIVTSANVTLSSADATNCDGQHLYLFSLASGGAINGAPSTANCGAPGNGPLPYGAPLITSGTQTYTITLLASDDQISGPLTCGVNGIDIYGARVIIGV